MIQTLDAISQRLDKAQQIKRDMVQNTQTQVSRLKLDIEKLKRDYDCNERQKKQQIEDLVELDDSQQNFQIIPPEMLEHIPHDIQNFMAAPLTFVCESTNTQLEFNDRGLLVLQQPFFDSLVQGHIEQADGIRLKEEILKTIDQFLKHFGIIILSTTQFRPEYQEIYMLLVDQGLPAFKTLIEKLQACMKNVYPVIYDQEYAALIRIIDMSRALLGSVNISVRSSKIINKDHLRMLQQRVEVQQKEEKKRLEEQQKIDQDKKYIDQMAQNPIDYINQQLVEAGIKLVLKDKLEFEDHYANQVHLEATAISILNQNPIVAARRVSLQKIRMLLKDTLELVNRLYIALKTPENHTTEEIKKAAIALQYMKQLVLAFNRIRDGSEESVEQLTINVQESFKIILPQLAEGKQPVSARV